MLATPFVGPDSALPHNCQMATSSNTDTTANNGFEAKLWAAADALRNNMDAAEYKHVVLGLVFLKYISDAFEINAPNWRPRTRPRRVPEDPDEYRAVSIFWVPEGGTLGHIKANAPQPNIGQLVDDAMAAIERDNLTLKVCSRKTLGALVSKATPGQSDRSGHRPCSWDCTGRSKDTLGRVYEYFGGFASAEGKRGGQFYTPSRVVRLLVEMLAPYKGRVYDPCCGSGGMFVQTAEFIEAHGGRVGDIADLRAGIELHHVASGEDEPRHSRHRRQHRDTAIRFTTISTPTSRPTSCSPIPPFNDSDWRGELLKEDKRWKFGVPPASNANFAWVQHFIHHLAPTGIAGFVLANGSMSSNTSGEGEIRKAIIEADLVDCMVALPGQLFYSTQIPVCLWFIARDKKNGRFRDRRGEMLFIDARQTGAMDRSRASRAG